MMFAWEYSLQVNSIKSGKYSEWGEKQRVILLPQKRDK
ncbi:hypothetical protein KKH3_01900 [Pectobacterium actinidiae]|nr:hypothetical protein KKH3_01900 [Pectobacterium actinidiae]